MSFEVFRTDFEALGRGFRQLRCSGGVLALPTWSLSLSMDLLHARWFCARCSKRRSFFHRSSFSQGASLELDSRCCVHAYDTKIASFQCMAAVRLWTTIRVDSLAAARDEAASDYGFCVAQAQSCPTLMRRARRLP